MDDLRRLRTADPQPPEPGQPRPPVQRDWRDTLRAASDLALTGIVMTIAALPIVTAGAAVGAASTAVAKYTDQERFPGVRDTARDFARGILPGIPPLLIAIAAGVLIRLNIHALDVGLVPGGRPLIWATLLLALAGAGFAAMVVVEFGRSGAGWRAAVRDAARLVVARPGLLAGSAGIMAFTIGLGYLIQAILVPILAGYALLALHVIRRRPGRAPAGS
ncbi:hypothetical protein J2S43_006693 [Catenuloplanes nepalensis]|uniref:DUF624 domain-containing protein n=1 Tax=Catenuloplanes nepalensis TaxID=587533 RepID=A0ABT9N432_9ACTN|nr:hypothetical protein [Catenuloplanes nepalensis]MDP9798181.1 hypothetical protein [Catenuloplanes nepalensis]